MIKELVPYFKKRISDLVLPGRNRARIVVGTDRKNSSDSGYGDGGKSQKNSSAIDVVCGFVGEDVDFINDKSRIYISEKTDLDDYMQITKGNRAVGTPGVGIISDNIYMKSRSQFKIIRGNSSVIIDDSGNITIETTAEIKLKSGPSVVRINSAGVVLGSENGIQARVLTELDSGVVTLPNGTSIPVLFSTAPGIYANPLVRLNNSRIKISL